MKFLSHFLLLFMIAGLAPVMAQTAPTLQSVFTGTNNNDGTGTPGRQAFQIIDNDLTELSTYIYPVITGDITGGGGTNVLTIGANAVTTGKMAQLPAGTVWCNALSFQSNAQTCTFAQLATLLGVGSSGGTGGGTGTISSIALTLPAIFNAVPPLASSGTFAISFATGQPANQFLATPCGAAGPVGLRTLCTGDIPNVTLGPVQITNGVSAIQPGTVTYSMLAPAVGPVALCQPNTGSGNFIACTATQIAAIAGTTSGGGGGTTVTGSGTPITNEIDACTAKGVDPTGATDSDAAFNTVALSVAGTGQTLVVGCPIKLSIGYNINAPIFIHNNSKWRFDPGGMLIVDNNTIPALVMLNPDNIILQNLTIEYVGTVTLNNAVAPYVGVAGQFNDGPEKTYLQTYSGNTFTNGGSMMWDGPGNICALLVIRGSAHNVHVNNPYFFAPENANSISYIPTGFDIGYNWLPNTTVNTNSATPTSANAIGPTDLTILNPTLDGFYMGFTGTGGSPLIINPRFLRYSDVHDSSGGTQGGVSNWFPPPHAMYLQGGDPSLNAHTTVFNGEDDGPYNGPAIRRAANGSGTLLSLKLEVTNGASVIGWVSHRPDGCMDLITNYASPNGGTLKNITCYYDSSTKGSDGTNVWGWRFPSAGAYQNLNVQNFTIYDLATVPTNFPIVGNGYSTNQDVSITGLKVFAKDIPLNSTYTPGFQFGGTNINIEGEYHFAVDSTTTQYEGPLVEQGITYCVSCNFDLKIFGWRQVPVTFSGALASGATTAPLSVSWPLASGTYTLNFPDGETRQVTLTNGSTTPGSWAALTAAQPATGTVVSGVLPNNFNAYKPRLLVNYALGSANTKVHLTDVSNGYEAYINNGTLEEYLTLLYQGSPSGASVNTGMNFPGTMASDRNSVFVNTAITGATSFNIGWSGNTTALRSGVGVSGNTNPFSPITPSVAFPSNPTAILLTPVGGNFTGGKVSVSVRGSQMSAAQ